MQAFGQALPGADVALFYFSGHGMQVQGVNWLVPVDANPTGNQDLDFQMIDASLVLRQMESAGTRLNLLILDACRNNPFAFRGMRGSQSGLAEMRAPEGTLISYATQPGNVAADGSTGNSPYTASLAAAMQRPGLDVFQIFNQVGLAVKDMTRGQQQPWLASSPIAGTFFFFSGPVTIAPPPASADAEAIYWQSIAASQNPEDFRSYLRRFPRGVYVPSSRNGAWRRWVRRRLGCRARPIRRRLAPEADVQRHGRRRRGFPAGNVDHHQELGPARRERYQGAAELSGAGRRGPAGRHCPTDGGRSHRGAAGTTLGHQPPGTRFSFHAKAKFEPTHATGTRVEKRPCDLDFTRQ